METLENIKKIVATFKVGDLISVYTPNHTCRNGSARYYQREGIFNGIVKNKWGHDSVEVLIGSNKRRYRFELTNDFYCKWDENNVRHDIITEFCSDIAFISKLS